MEKKIESALAWAKSQSGKYIQPCETVGCKYNSSQTGNTACNTPTFRADADDLKKGNHEDGHSLWNFYCMRFVRTAYGTPAQYEKAIDMYEALHAKGLVRSDSDIPAGALVFWYWSNFGHIGIHAGDGKVIHTGVNAKLKKKGIRESPLEDITEVLNPFSISEERKTSYLGWTYPPETWLR